MFWRTEFTNMCSHKIFWRTEITKLCSQNDQSRTTYYINWAIDCVQLVLLLTITRITKVTTFTLNSSQLVNKRKDSWLYCAFLVLRRQTEASVRTRKAQYNNLSFLLFTRCSVNVFILRARRKNSSKRWFVFMSSRS